MPKNKYPAIKYTDRDFNSIRENLIDYAKRYYPDSFKDFNEASFGALMVDAVSYIGDMLSFYVDYHANESFLVTSNEYTNVIKHGKALGYKFNNIPSSRGFVTLFIKVPASTTGFGIDTDYVPTLSKGSSFSTTSGTSFLLIGDVNFGDPKNEIVVASTNEDSGLPTEYVIKAYGEVISGRLDYQEFKLGEFQRFRKIQLSDSNVAEIMNVSDSEGNRYYEVDFLSQNTVYISVINTGADKGTVPNLLRPLVVPRRFVLERENGKVFMQFGYGSDKDASKLGFLRPEDVTLEMHARDYISDTSFDPAKLIKSDKFGICPSKTTLRVSFRTNSQTNINAAAGSILQVQKANFSFNNSSALSNSQKSTIINSLEVNNEEPVLGDLTYPSLEEIKRRIYDTFPTQNRAVTASDYKAIVYLMPGKYGSIKRCNVLQDPDAFKRNLNLYVVSEDQNGNLATTNDVIKNNLKNWVNRYRMINDSVDILNAQIVHIGINYTIVPVLERDRFEVLKKTQDALRLRFSTIGDIGESIEISDIYRILNTVPGVSDTVDVSLVKKSGGLYSQVDFSIDNAMSFDGRYLISPPTVIFEIKYLDTDIQGTVR